MDPISTAALAFSAGSSILGGIGQYQQAQAEAEMNEVNAYIGKTRAIETDTQARQGLSSELSSIRSAFASNEQRANPSTFSIMQELREERDRSRRIDTGNQMRQSYDFQQRARNARSKGGYALATGFVKAGPSLFDIYQTQWGG